VLNRAREHGAGLGARRVVVVTGSGRVVPVDGRVVLVVVDRWVDVRSVVFVVVFVVVVVVCSSMSLSIFCSVSLALVAASVALAAATLVLCSAPFRMRLARALIASAVNSVATIIRERTIDPTTMAVSGQFPGQFPFLGV
jgi:hypothetical protein